MVFTLIFQEFGVDCIGEDARMLLHIDRYNKRSLHWMGYQKVDDRWVRHVLGQRVARSNSLKDDDDDLIKRRMLRRSKHN